MQVMLRELFEKAPQIDLAFSNLTSETTTQGKVRMLSASIEGCALELPKGTCALGHQVLLRFLLRSKGSGKKSIEIVGKILELHPHEKSCEVRIQFNQYVKEEWLHLLGIWE